jgi:hypothetical protein
VTGRALRDLYSALTSLLRTPVRVYRILRPAGA